METSVQTRLMKRGPKQSAARQQVEEHQCTKHEHQSMTIQHSGALAACLRLEISASWTVLRFFFLPPLSSTPAASASHSACSGPACLKKYSEDKKKREENRGQKKNGGKKKFATACQMLEGRTQKNVPLFFNKSKKRHNGSAAFFCGRGQEACRALGGGGVASAAAWLLIVFACPRLSEARARRGGI